MNAEKLKESQILAALQGVSDDNQLWQAIHAIIDNQSADELEALLAPNLTDNATHYNRGRVAMLLDLKTALNAKRADAQREDPKPEAHP